MSNFVTVTKQEFEEWLPKDFEVINDFRSKEYIYQINTDKESLAVRIYSSVDKFTNQTRDKGDDAIRVILWDLLNTNPIGKGKRINRVEGATLIKNRIQQRINEFLQNTKDIEIKKKPTVKMWSQTDPAYVKAILESKVLKRSNFAQSLLENLNRFGRLTDNQLPYVLGEQSPKGYPTFETKVKTEDPEAIQSFIDKLFEEEGNEDQRSESKTEKSQDIPEVSDRPRYDKIEPITGDEVERIRTETYPDWKYKFLEFNPVQSLILPLRDKDVNIILSANTSAGKTVAAELIMDHVLKYGV